jgi:hypothetical protein
VGTGWTTVDAGEVQDLGAVFYTGLGESGNFAAATSGVREPAAECGAQRDDGNDQRRRR